VESCDGHKVVRTTKLLPDSNIMDMVDILETKKMPKNSPRLPFHRGMLNKEFYEMVNDRLKVLDKELINAFALNLPNTSEEDCKQGNVGENAEKMEQDSPPTTRGSTPPGNPEEEPMETDDSNYIFNGVKVTKITCGGLISKLEADTTINEFLRRETSQEILVIIGNDIDHIVFAIVSILNKANKDWYKVDKKNGKNGILFF